MGCSSQRGQRRLPVLVVLRTSDADQRRVLDLLSWLDARVSRRRARIGPNTVLARPATVRLSSSTRVASCRRLKRHRLVTGRSRSLEKGGAVDSSGCVRFGYRAEKDHRRLRRATEMRSSSDAGSREAMSSAIGRGRQSNRGTGIQDRHRLSHCSVSATNVPARGGAHRSHVADRHLRALARACRSSPDHDSAP